MKRRAFVVLSLAALGAPAVVIAQSTDKLYRIGWLDLSSAAENLGTFEQALGARGWTKGRNFRIEYRGAEGNLDALQRAAAALVGAPVDVIVAPGTPELLAARKATTAIPVVMVGVDAPVERGIVASLARPGGNVTGLASTHRDLSAKLLSLLHELVPAAPGVVVLWDTNDADHRIIVQHLQAAAGALRMSVNAVGVKHHSEVEPALAALKQPSRSPLIVPASTMLVPLWIADLALKYRLPLASTAPAYAYEGGLIAYAEDWKAVFDRVANYVDRILRGAKPADLPIELPAQFRLIVNAKTAQKLGIAVPSSIALRADYIVK